MNTLELKDSQYIDGEEYLNKVYIGHIKNS
jgi:hypothetical protein